MPYSMCYNLFYTCTRILLSYGSWVSKYWLKMSYVHHLRARVGKVGQLLQQDWLASQTGWRIEVRQSSSTDSFFSLLSYFSSRYFSILLLTNFYFCAFLIHIEPFCIAWMYSPFHSFIGQVSEQDWLARCQSRTGWPGVRAGLVGQVLEQNWLTSF